MKLPSWLKITASTKRHPLMVWFHLVLRFSYHRYISVKFCSIEQLQLLSVFKKFGEVSTDLFLFSVIKLIIPDKKTFKEGSMRFIHLKLNFKVEFIL